ncbi:hypothetical protein [Acetobacter senegalensis]|uniref:hypothetical protein n=1 Tax=Acetobacter senegalensis TaxID=446692 RepID=UPI0026501729|nr:hypothetical protein [Acetobacter senegalensis]MDN7354228.1 hypothetical protein [Acetobacter senegalensis]
MHHHPLFPVASWHLPPKNLARRKTTNITPETLYAPVSDDPTLRIRLIMRYTSNQHDAAMG